MDIRKRVLFNDGFLQQVYMLFGVSLSILFRHWAGLGGVCSDIDASVSSNSTATSPRGERDLLDLHLIVQSRLCGSITAVVLL